MQAPSSTRVSASTTWGPASSRPHWALGHPPTPRSWKNPEHAIGSAASNANAYGYAGQTPVIAKDDDGHWIHVAIGAGIGAVLSGGIEAYNQYHATGHIESWGRVLEKSGVGAAAGAVTALAGPQAGLATVVALGTTAGVARGPRKDLLRAAAKVSERAKTSLSTRGSARLPPA